MNKTIKARWLRALRSDKFKQGREQLRDGDRFCCLGVLCELAERSGVIESYKGNYLPADVVTWAGVPNNDPIVLGRALADRNDGVEGRPQNFKQIANLIERHL